MATQDIQGMLVRIEATTAQLRRELDSGDSRIRRFANDADASTGKVAKSFSNLAGVAKGALLPLAAAIASMAGLGKIVEAQRSFDVLNAGLITATGSSEKAAQAFEILQQFAAKTPYSLDQAVKGFTQLVNLGLNPSERALTSYGNTAAAMGKDLSQMIEAVADASTGEFERLKEFGIKASQQKDKVTLVFKGVSTTVKNNSADIQNYLIKLGETDFAGAMEKRAATLDGAISNLGDTFDQLLLTISRGGLGELVRDAVNEAVKGLSQLTDWFASGQMMEYLNGLALEFSGWGDSIAETFRWVAEKVSELMSALFEALDADGQEWVRNLLEHINHLPMYVRQSLKVLVADFVSGFDSIIAYASAFKQGLQTIFSTKVFDKAAWDQVGDTLNTTLEGINATRQQSIDLAVQEVEDNKILLEGEVEAARQRKAIYEAEQARKKKAREDALKNGQDPLSGTVGKPGGTKKPPTGDTGPTDAEKKAAAKAAAKKAQDLKDYLAEIQLKVQAAKAQANAYLQGKDAVSALAREEEIEAQVLKLGAAARGEVTGAVNRLKDAQEALDLIKHTYEIQQETREIELQMAATIAGTAALKQYNDEKLLRAQLAGTNIAADSAEAKAQLAAITANRQAAESLHAVGEGLQDIRDRYDPLASVTRAYKADQETLNLAMAKGALTQAEYTTLMGKLGDTYEQEKAKVSSWGQLTQDALERINQAGANLWKNLLTGAKGSLGSVKELFLQTLAEMLHAAITKRIVFQIGAALDIPGAAQSLNSLGGGGNILDSLGNIGSSLSDVGSKISSAYQSGGASGVFDLAKSGVSNLFNSGSIGSLLGSSSSAGSSAVSSVGSVGFGLGKSQLVSGAMGNASYASSAASGTTQAASQAASSLGNLATAANMAATAWNVYSGFKASTAQGVGAVIGAAIGATVGGPIGAAIGSTLGKLAGSLFGGKGEQFPRKVSASSGSYDMTTGKYTDKGWPTGYYDKEKRYGAAYDKALGQMTTNVGTALGTLYKAFGNVGDLAVSATARQRRTSGKLVGNLYIDGLTFKEQFKGKDALQNFYNKATGQWLAQAINKSRLPSYFTQQFAGLADDAKTTSEQIREKIDGIFKNFDGVNAALQIVGKTAYGLTNAGMQASDALLEAAGGLDALQNAVSNYYDQFYSEADKIQDTLTGVTKAFSAANIQLPTTRAAYKAMVDAADTTTEAGRAMFATLMKLAAGADAYFNVLEGKAQQLLENTATFYEQFTSEQDKANDTLVSLKAAFVAANESLPATRQGFIGLVKALDTTTTSGEDAYRSLMSLAAQADAYYDLLESNAAAAFQAAQEVAAATVNALFGKLQRTVSAAQKQLTDVFNAQIDGLQGLADASSSTISTLQSAFEDLDGTLKTLLGSSSEATDILYQQAHAQAQFALGYARAGGSLSNLSGLSDTLQALSNNSTDRYSSLQDYQLDQNIAANTVAALKAEAGVQLTTEQQILATLNDGIANLKDYYEQQMAWLDSQVDMVQSMLDALNGIDNSIYETTSSVNSLAAPISGVSNAVTASGNSVLNGVGGKVTSMGTSVTGAVNGLTNPIAALGGNINAVGGTVINGLASPLGSVNASVQGLNIPINALGGTVINGLSNPIAQVSQNVQGLITPINVLGNTVVNGVGGSVTGLVSPINLVGKNVQGLLSPIGLVGQNVLGLTNPIGAVTSSVIGLNNPLNAVASNVWGLTNPIDAVRGSVANLTNPIYAVGDKVFGLISPIQTVGSSVTALGGTVVNGVGGKLTTLGMTVTGSVNNASDHINGVWAAVNSVGGNLGTLTNSVNGLSPNIVSGVGGSLNNLGGTVVGGVGGAVNTATGAINAVKGTVNTVTGAVYGVSGAVSAVQNAVNTVTHSVNAVKAAVGEVGGGINGVTGAVGAVTLAVMEMNKAVVAALSTMADGLSAQNTVANNAALVDTLYKAIFNRTADASGAAYWTSQLQSGLIDYDQIGVAMARTASGADAVPANTYLQGIVGTAFNSVLSRTPDASSRDYWVGQLKSGAIAGDQLTTAIARSATGTDKAAGDAWLLAHGIGTPVVAQPVVTPPPTPVVTPPAPTTTDYAPQINLAYLKVLGHNPDAASLSTWNAQLNSGSLAIAELEQMIARSAPKADIPAATKYLQGIVQTAYQTVFKRAATSGGLSQWVERLRSGSTLFSQLNLELAKSASGKDSTPANAWLKANSVPGYALGGFHVGGLRLVGEEGPELEVTGPSRIYSARDTQEIFAGGSETTQEIRALRRQVQSLERLLYQVTKNTKEAADGINQQNQSGLAVEIV